MSEGFSDLPEALVRDLLAIATPVAQHVASTFETFAEHAPRLRRQSQDAGLIRRKADLDVAREPSVVAVDGSYQLHRLSAMDLCAGAAVAVEGTAKEEARRWPEPRHLMWVDCVGHSKNATNALRGVMISMEVELASLAPHDFVLLDGSFIVFVIYLNQGLTSLRDAPESLAQELNERWERVRILPCLLRMLQSDRVLALPKYSQRNELAIALGDAASGTDGRTLASLVLQPGEYTAPLPVFLTEREPDEYHLPRSYATEAEVSELNRAIAGLRVVFFKPFGWCPALRIEMPAAVANSPTRLALALTGLERQMFTPAVIEPYPLFLADRMVKSLGAGVQAVEHAVAQHVVAASNDHERVIMMLQNYRTEGGRA